MLCFSSTFKFFHKTCLNGRSYKWKKQFIFCNLHIQGSTWKGVVPSYFFSKVCVVMSGKVTCFTNCTWCPFQTSQGSSHLGFAKYMHACLGQKKMLFLFSEKFNCFLIFDEIKWYFSQSLHAMSIEFSSPTERKQTSE